MESNRFRVIVNQDSKGEILCFCPYDEYLKGLCVCREKYDCPEAIIELTVLPNSRPSDKVVAAVEKGKREVKSAEREIKRSADRIKQGVNRLERVAGKNRWRI
ncbi:MAG: hypothetical protein GF334_01500 [Candidatus Altiarchaeales archaeon]|nr:hypothetical protein [Candidatus Altiarchaeales archaeon]